MASNVFIAMHMMMDSFREAKLSVNLLDVN